MVNEGRRRKPATVFHMLRVDRKMWRLRVTGWGKLLVNQRFEGHHRNTRINPLKNATLGSSPQPED